MTIENGQPVVLPLATGMVLVIPHYGRAAQTQYHSFGSEDRSYLGWCLVPDSDPESYCFVYMVPDTEADVPTVLVYQGMSGYPDEDNLVARVEVK